LSFIIGINILSYKKRGLKNRHPFMAPNDMAKIYEINNLQNLIYSHIHNILGASKNTT
jgi:hypothetical protein